ncbi:hypothetical protein [Aliikangiella sp. IMCC44359]|uniref:hypothetical protein n=1 Tax=Aliikangiella sp. IMCC44359 TaxID=3459125 RepID=UPI00403ADA99
MKINFRQNHVISFLVGCLLVISGSLFWQGSTGTFLFDDFANLPQMTLVKDIESFTKYLLSGIAGPTGRPVSLLSFIIFSEHWPNNPQIFIITNIAIHLFNTLLVYILVNQLLKLTAYSPHRLIIALLVASLWSVLPNHVSSVIYIIQRMTILAATFSLISIIFNIQYLLSIAGNQTPQIKYWVMSCLALGLAILSKENAATTFIINYFLFYLVTSPLSNTKQFIYLRRFFGFFSLLLIFYLLSYVVNSEYAYSGRSFNLTERLLTQFVLFIKHFSYFIFPRPITTGLFNDQITVISSTSEYITAIFIGLIIISINIYCLIRLIKKQCIYAFWSLFFFANHLIESTVVPLELYYEHRNYFPYIGLAALLIHVAFDLKRYRPVVVISLLSLFFLANYYCLYQRASLWGKPLYAASYWANLNPDSVRAQENAAVKFSQAKKFDQSIHYLKQAYQLEQSPFIMLNAINLSCKGKFSLDGILFNPEIYKSANNSNRDFQVALETVNLSNKNLCHHYDSNDLLVMLNNILDNPDYQSTKDQQQYTHLRAIVHFQLKQLNEAINDFEKSLLLHPQVDVLLLQTATIASNGYCREAIAYLNQYKTIAFKYNRKERLIEYLYPSNGQIEEYMVQLMTECNKTLKTTG